MVGAIFSMGASMANNAMAAARESRARYENYTYNEMAAKEADKRTRALYNDLYSPKAQLKQIKDAGLSPSIFYGDMAGISGTSGAQGGGAGGISPNVYGISALEAAQIGLLNAQKDKVEEETRGTKTTNEILGIEKSMKEIEFDKYNIDYNVLTEYVNINGQRMSLFEYANTCSSYEKFINELRKMGIADRMVNTELGQQSLREIFKATRTLKTEIATLSEEEISANFQRAIVNELSKSEFAQKNAEAAVQELKMQISTNELTESQKEAWNNLLNHFGKKGSTTRDIAIVLGLLIANAANHVSISATIPTRDKKR